ncbi:alanyl-tRNA editing protein [Photobacterium sp. ZSDE20]|uniref:Alanyl-tRNA editing protein n=1 Tax=Photobacterium pectinilyticum TaxID=2906793 RepID=A0ABT1MZX1_9GAMM|nr:alanyl-tRNA editing protein [Photobacterium sp. ZSDE20]MCQ1057041.1 alanyl-tRNA editing protein [Photobacterium sp. ZSDE20]MDD1821176.1 alanyl-tRNA editing protein [Photobacterium sp. ZSDE20]
MIVISATHVLFPERIYQCEADVQLTAVATPSQGCYVVTDKTPFHPVSHIWPDHPADRGTLTLAGQAYEVVDCLVGAVEQQSGQLHVGKDIPVKRDEPGWVFVVVHQLAEVVDLHAGCKVMLNVDEHYQLALSRGHSGGHLSSLALNKVLHHDFWRKDASRKDELGHYDFHSYAQTESRVTEDCSTDTYRIGKTLRKRGLNAADMLAALPVITEQINQQLALWCEAGYPVHLRREGEALTDSRYWRCDLQEGQVVEIPCGGTHVRSLAEYAALRVEFRIDSDQELVMLTYSNPA